MEPVEQWQFVYFTDWAGRGERSGQVGGRSWDVLAAEGDAGGGKDAKGQSAPPWAHLQLLLSSDLWCLSPCQQQTSACWGLYLTLYWDGESEDFSDNSHTRSTWLVRCAGFAVAQQCWQVKIALLLNMLQ